MNLFLFYAFKFPTLLNLVWKIMCLSHSGKEKIKEQKAQKRQLYCSVSQTEVLDWHLLAAPPSPQGGPAVGAKQMVQRCSLARLPQPHLAAREGQGGCVAPQECNERHFSTTCLRYTALSWASNQDAPNVHKLEWHRENNVFLTFLRGRTVLFWLKTLEKE